jgi:glycine dehydrogenase
LIAIRGEIRDIEAGVLDRHDNPLKNAPHTAEVVTADEWKHPYSRQRAAYPLLWVKKHKFWPSVSRVNDVLGDRKLVCSCPPIEEYM